jgi:hypothetical protein
MEGSRKRSAALDDFEVEEEEAVAGWDPKVVSGGDPFAAGLGPGAAVALLRSERKRIREQKRRSETKRGFDELTGLLVEIDPEVRSMAEERSGGGGAHEDGALSRVDLIDRTVTVLRRIHRENEQSKALIDRMMRLRDLPVQLDLPGRDEVRRIQKHC